MIETERLAIHPLSHAQLLKYIQNDGSLEAELGLTATIREMSPDLKDALESTILPNVADPTKNYLFSTLWSMISKSENRMVGDLCFIGQPDADGQIEIGYGTYELFQKQGFMTEAVAGMIGWAGGQSGVLSIFAATEKSNPASFSVLQKNGFKKAGETEDLFQWRLMLENKTKND